MSTIVVKLRKTYLALVLLLLITLWQGYGLYQSKIAGINRLTYMCSKVIANVIPGSMISGQPKEENLISRMIYEVTEIDMTSYRTLVERNIPLLKNQVVVGSSEEYNTLTGIKGKKTVEADADYFGPNDELFITNTQKPIELGKAVTKEQLEDDSFVTSKLINFDSNLNNKNQAMDQLDMIKLLGKRFTIEGKAGPKVLIFNTHWHERFAGEEPGSEGVVDLGRYLKEILETQYGVETMHCTSRFKKTDDNATKDDYGRMNIEVAKIIEENPSIEVTIDIHRDGVGGDQKFSTNINGKETAKLMFVNGFSQIQKNGVLSPIESLPNPYVEDNMALALQIQLKAMEKYPGFIRKSLVKPYRYSLHFKPKSFLIEVGNENNIKEEGLNTMEVFAELLMDVIEKD